MSLNKNSLKNINKSNIILFEQAYSKVDSYRIKINDIVNKCIKAGLKDELIIYTRPIMRDYQLQNNPTADNRRLPWKVFLEELEGKTAIDSELLDHLDMFINEAEQCYKDNTKSKIEEASRNELLALTKSQTITRYNKAAGYKGFSIVDIDTSMLLRDDTITVTCRVGDYYDTIQLMDILIWIQLEAERNENNQVNTKNITQALMEAIDALEIKVNCTCGDWQYRFAYQATILDYKYGKPENRPAKITNPNNYGALCKHLTSMLSNKKWLQQVTGSIMDWIEKHIDEVNKYLRVKEGQELTLPNELARRNAKLGFYSKLFKDKLDEPEEEVEDNDNNDNNDVKSNDDSDVLDNVDDIDNNMDNTEDNKDDLEVKNNSNNNDNTTNNTINKEEQDNESEE